MRLFSDRGTDVASHLEGHGGELPLLKLSNYRYVRAHFAPEEPVHAQLRALQHAVEEAPGLELCRHGTAIRRRVPPPMPLTPADEEPHSEGRESPSSLLVLLLPVEGPPRYIELAARSDYIYTITETLGVPCVYPRLLGKARTPASGCHQPILYYGVWPEGPAEDSRRNELASLMCGETVVGDVILAAADNDYRGQLIMHEATGASATVRTLYSFLARQHSGIAGFVAVVWGIPFLGSWRVPRPEARWPGQKNAKAVLQEYHQVHPPSGSIAIEGTGSSFVGVARLHGWPAEAPLPAGAAAMVEEGREGPASCTIEMRTRACGRRTGSKKRARSPGGDERLVVSAEDAATVILMSAMVERDRFLKTRVDSDGATGLRPLLPAFVLDPWHDADGGDQDSAESHEDGTRLVCSYSLRLLGWNASQIPGGADGELLEEVEQLEVLLGGQVIAPELEEALRVTRPEDGEQRMALSGRLFGQPCSVLLRFTVHSTAPPIEVPKVLTGGESGSGHAAERRERIAQLVADCAPASLVDIGCGEGKLLASLLRQRVAASTLRHVAGVDAAPGTAMLRRAARAADSALREVTADNEENLPTPSPDANGTRPHTTLASYASQAGSAPWAHSRRLSLPSSLHSTPCPHFLGVTPSVQFWRGTLGTIELNHEMVLLIEVIEHLDLPDAELSAFLTRSRPRRLLLTTPNKEYNLNWMARPEELGAGAPLPRPPVSSLPLRNLDHRFEFTRSEFREWATRLAGQHGYEVSLSGIGGAPLDDVVPFGVWRGAGPVTLVAMFERRGGVEDLASPRACNGAPYVNPATAEQVWPVAAVTNAA